MLWYEYLIITGAPTVAICYVGYILRQQIKSQKTLIENLNGMINNLTNYNNTLDWKKVKDWYESFEIPTQKEITRQEVIKEYGKSTEEHEKFIDDYNELLNYFYTVVKGMNELHPNFAKDRILTGLPNNAKYFRDIWQDDEQQTHDTENISPLK